MTVDTGHLVRLYIMNPVLAALPSGINTSETTFDPDLI